MQQLNTLVTILSSQLASSYMPHIYTPLHHLDVHFVYHLHILSFLCAAWSIDSTDCFLCYNGHRLWAGP